SGLFAAAIVAGIAGFLASFLIVRGGDLTRLMVTLGIGLMLYEAANKAAFITGGVDGLSGVTMWKILGLFSFDIAGKTAYVDSLGFPRSAELMIMLVLGGVGRLYGALIGAAVFMIAKDYLSGLNPVYWEFWLGVLLIVIVMVGHGGIMGRAEALWSWARSRTR